MPLVDAPSPYRDFIAGLPKAELHVHQVGSASPRIVADLAARHPGRVPADESELARFFTFRDFAHFIELYLSVVDLVRTPQDVRLLTYEVARDMAAQTIRYAELTLTPFSSVLVGIPIEEFMAAVEDARVAAERDLGLVLRWIFDIPGEFGVPAADATPGRGVDRHRHGDLGEIDAVEQLAHVFEGIDGDAERPTSPATADRRSPGP